MKDASPGLVFTVLLAAQILFGISYAPSKALVAVYPPLWWASVRCILAAACLLSMALASRRPHPRARLAYFLPVAGFALLGAVLNQGFFLVGLHYTTTTNAAILNTLIPVFTLLIVVVLGKERLTAGRAWGFALALVGVLVLRRAETFTFSDRTARGDLLMLANTTAYSAFLALSKDFVERHDRLWTTAWFFVFGAIGLSVVALPEWRHFHPPPLTEAFAFYIAVVVLAGTVLSYYLINWALARTDSSRVALFVYVQPVVATAVACAFFGEVLTLRTTLSALILFAGVYLASRPLPVTEPLAPEFA